MDFRQALDLHFPKAISDDDFVRSSYSSLSPHGFSSHNTIACVGVCRDEITRPLIDNIQKYWGEAFNFCSLAGLLTSGKTGFSAAEHHAPVEHERERYVYYAMPHIAIDENGEIGVCSRPGRPGPSGACGALIAFRREMLEGALNLESDPDDVEQSLLKQRLFKKIRYGDIPDLVTLTKITYQEVLEELMHMIGITVNTAHSDYAVFTGIQIHGPDRQEFVWPGEMYAMVRGQRTELVLANP
ncbi:hypothetical protein SAMN04489760_103159 [Syntrophus gentianae]|uniref:Limiting CO2-inducible protein B/C beta carbonyic anhydrase domain-containing protein n=1 Tax=Syntrophus gentianae TaxID=43775 RepID=A0A1H7VBP3_9BACT|nr:hypothetical protein [Syntrophus gentianae]SEM06701.1 hypothetical protein SAMN04489760_103159 [Syntrophus gentianae]